MVLCSMQPYFGLPFSFIYIFFLVLFCFGFYVSYFINLSYLCLTSYIWFHHEHHAKFIKCQQNIWTNPNRSSEKKNTIQVYCKSSLCIKCTMHTYQGTWLYSQNWKKIILQFSFLFLNFSYFKWYLHTN